MDQHLEYFVYIQTIWIIEVFTFWFPLPQLIMSLPQVEACAVGLYEGSRLLAFVVASTSGDQRAASPLPSVQQHVDKSPSTFPRHQEEDLPSPVKLHQEETSGADGDLSRLIVNQLSLLLPSHSVPDTLVLVPALCLTPHGERWTQGTPEETRHVSSILGILN